MYILKNAFQNLGRNKKRNLLLGTILLAVIISTTVSLVINSTTKEIINDYKGRFGSKVTLSVDFDQLMKDSQANEDGSFYFPEAPSISSEQYLSFADSKLLKSHHLVLKAGISFEKLKAINEQKDNGMIGSIGPDNTEYVMPKAKILGYSDLEQIEDFNDGARKIIDGKIFENKNECLVSSEFAKLNDLKIGSEFVIVDSSNKNKKTSLKVVGIYADATKENGDLPDGALSFAGSYDNRRNEIIVSMGTMTELFLAKDLIVDAEYELFSPDLVKDFEKEIRKKGLPDSYIVGADEASYNRIVQPVLGLSNISGSFLSIILLVGIIILLFVTNLVIQERKYEIGVLRAIGLKKVKVAGMIVAEMLMITFITLGIGLTIGSFAAQPIADVLIKDQAKIERNNDNGGGITGGISTSVGGTTNVKPLSEIHVSLTGEATIQIILVALGLALISSVSGVIFITKYEPMKILSERG